MSARASARRVVITGVGAVSPLAVDTAEHHRRLAAGESAVAHLAKPCFQEPEATLGGAVSGFDRRRLIGHRMLRKLLPPSAAFAVVAGDQALSQAALTDSPEVLDRTGLYVGSVCIDFDPEVFLEALRESIDPEGGLDLGRFATRGRHLIDPLFLVKSLPNAGLGGLAIQHQIHGPSLNITNGSVSGLQSVLLAAAAVRRGTLDVAVAGGYDSLLGMDSVAEHLIAGRLSPLADEPARAVRPFARERQGYAVAEGACFVVLEEASHAKRRGVAALAEILGSGQAGGVPNSEAPTNGRPSALLQSAERALAGTSDGLPDAVFGDGLATDVDDRVEAQALARLTAQRSNGTAPGAAAPPPFTAATGALGFTGAASGAFSLLHAVEALRRQILPPTLNCEEPDPGLPICPVRQAQTGHLERVLVWCSDRGVKSVAVLLGTPRG